MAMYGAFVQDPLASFAAGGASHCLGSNVFKIKCFICFFCWGSGGSSFSVIMGGEELDKGQKQQR